MELKRREEKAKACKIYNFINLLNSYGYDERYCDKRLKGINS